MFIALETLGLPSKAPTFSNDNVIAWEPFGEYKSVRVFPADGKVDYAYIQVLKK